MLLSGTLLLLLSAKRILLYIEPLLMYMACASERKEGIETVQVHCHAICGVATLLEQPYCSMQT
jgi:hypothetical protein